MFINQRFLKNWIFSFLCFLHHSAFHQTPFWNNSRMINILLPSNTGKEMLTYLWDTSLKRRVVHIFSCSWHLHFVPLGEPQWGNTSIALQVSVNSMKMFVPVLLFSSFLFPTFSFIKEHLVCVGWENVQLIKLLIIFKLLPYSPLYEFSKYKDTTILVILRKLFFLTHLWFQFLSFWSNQHLFNSFKTMVSNTRPWRKSRGHSRCNAV